MVRCITPEPKYVLPNVFADWARELCREPVSFVVARPASVFAAQRMGMSVVEIGERLTAPSVDHNPK